MTYVLYTTRKAKKPSDRWVQRDECRASSRREAVEIFKDRWPLFPTRRYERITPESPAETLVTSNEMYGQWKVRDAA